MQRPRARRERAQRLSGADRRAHLLDVAAAMLLDEGPDALTMEGVAQRAGVSKGLGYAYFANAEEIAVALYDREVDQVYRHIEAAMSSDHPFAERIRGALSAYLDVVAERGALFAILQARFSSRRLTRSVRRRVETFVEFWAREIRAELAIAEPIARTLAGGVLNFADACARSWGAGRLTRREVEDVCVAFLLSGMRGVAGSVKKPASAMGPLKEPLETKGS